MNEKVVFKPDWTQTGRRAKRLVKPRNPLRVTEENPESQVEPRTLKKTEIISKGAAVDKLVDSGFTKGAADELVKGWANSGAVQREGLAYLVPMGMVDRAIEMKDAPEEDEDG